MFRHSGLVSIQKVSDTAVLFQFKSVQTQRSSFDSQGFRHSGLVSIQKCFRHSGLVSTYAGTAFYTTIPKGVPRRVADPNNVFNDAHGISRCKQRSLTAGS